MTALPSTPYSFLLALHNIYTTATTCHTNLVREAIHFLVPTNASNINVLALEIKIIQI